MEELEHFWSFWLYTEWLQVLTALFECTGGVLSSECKSFCIRMLKAARRKQMIEEPNEYEMICFQANCENKMDVENTKRSGMP